MHFSNNYLFYRRGCRSINIVGILGSIKNFNKVRPCDINAECCVSGISGNLMYHRFNEYALNTFDANEAKHKNKLPYQMIGVIEVVIKRLYVLLVRYLPSGQQIDFLSVDVVGKDQEVPRCHDWSRYRPPFILAETLRTDMLKQEVFRLVQFLGSIVFRPVGKAITAYSLSVRGTNGLA